MGPGDMANENALYFHPERERERERDTDTTLNTCK